MKTVIKSKVMLGTMALAFMSLTSLAEVADQGNLLPPSHTGTSQFYTIGSYEAGQSFSPSVSGGLTSVIVDLSAAECYFNPNLKKIMIEVKIRRGEGYGGEIIATKEISIGVPYRRHLTRVYFDDMPMVEKNTKYTITLKNVTPEYCEPGSNTPLYFMWYHSGDDSYDRGKGFHHSTPSSHDYYFKTFIDPAANDGALNQVDTRIKIYPIPADKQLNVLWGDDRIKRVDILNMSGQVVKHKEVNDQPRVVLNTSEFDNGLYILQVEDENGNITRKTWLKRSN